MTLKKKPNERFSVLPLGKTIKEMNSISNLKALFKAVSIKHGLRTADYGLRTGYKIRTRYKTRTGKYGLGIKHGLGTKRGLRTVDYGLGTKYGLGIKCGLENTDVV